MSAPYADAATLPGVTDDDRFMRPPSRRRGRLQDCALYVTVEPCAMCAGAAILARVPLVVFGAPEEKTGAVRSTVDLFDDPRALHPPKWRMGARREEIERMLGEFFAGRRGPREVDG